MNEKFVEQKKKNSFLPVEIHTVFAVKSLEF